jgi:hypothetical protein
VPSTAWKVVTKKKHLGECGVGVHMEFSEDLEWKDIESHVQTAEQGEQKIRNAGDRSLRENREQIIEGFQMINRQLRLIDNCNKFRRGEHVKDHLVFEARNGKTAIDGGSAEEQFNHFRTVKNALSLRFDEYDYRGAIPGYPF